MVSGGSADPPHRYSNNIIGTLAPSGLTEASHNAKREALPESKKVKKLALRLF